MNQTLEDRLTNLEVEMPGNLVPRVLARAQHAPARGRFPRLLLTPALAVIILLLMLTGTLYAAPRFADVLASAPVIGGTTGAFLQSVGLGPIGSKLTPINDVAASSGYKIQLIAGYADSTQTVLVLRVSPPAELFFSSVLTDQFGRRVGPRGGSGDLRNGTTVVTFEQLPWPDQTVGARLTLHVSAVQPSPYSSASVNGSWTLHATLAAEPARNLPLPADGQIGTTRFHFTSMVRSGATLEVDMQVSGPLSSHLSDTVGETIPYVSKPHPAFNIVLVDATGSETHVGGGVSTGLGPATLRSWLVAAPGHYRIVVSFEGAGQFEREITVP